MLLQDINEAMVYELVSITDPQATDQVVDQSNLCTPISLFVILISGVEVVEDELMSKNVPLLCVCEVFIVGSCHDLHDDLKRLEPLPFLVYVVYHSWLNPIDVDRLIDCDQVCTQRQRYFVLVLELFRQLLHVRILVKVIEVELIAHGQGLVHEEVTTRVDELRDHLFEHASELVNGRTVDVELLDQIANHFTAERQWTLLRLQHHVD